MHRLSHRMFSLGISAALAFLLKLNILTLFVLLPLAYFIGSFPDIDVKSKLKHRGVTHSILFLVVMTIFLSIILFYFYWAFQLMIGQPVFDIEVVMYDWFPLPRFFELLGSFNFSELLNDSLFKFLAFFFASFMSHFFLDIITPSGLNVGDYNINGSIKSNSSFFNFLFGMIGLVTFALSLVFIVMREFNLASIDWYPWFFMIDGSLVVVIFLVSIFFKRGKGNKMLKCFKIDNKIDVCIPRGKCFQVGSDKDNTICNTFDFDMP